MKLPPGVYQAKKKNGTIYYRSSFTYRLKHISLGSFSSANEANKAYEEANLLIHSSSTIEEYNARKCTLSFNKWVCIINFRDNGVYIKTPIYMKHTYFLYYLTKYEIYTFDVDDLFYYSHHTIMKRGNHLFVADYGMQVTIFSRYGIKNYAVEGRDYQFVNGDHHDYRYSNILIINRYIGVSRITQPLDDLFIAKIHINGDYTIGTFSYEIDAAIAYNKAVDYIRLMGCKKNFEKNFIEEYNTEQYLEIYKKIKLPKNIIRLFQ